MEPEGLVRHIVVFKYNPETTEEKIRTITDAFRDLRGQIGEIISFEYGVNNSTEGLDQGFTHVHVVTFESAAARDTYLSHPAHQQFGELVNRLDVVDNVLVVDYVVQD